MPETTDRPTPKLLDEYRETLDALREHHRAALAAGDEKRAEELLREIMVYAPVCDYIATGLQEATPCNES